MFHVRSVLAAAGIATALTGVATAAVATPVTSVDITAGAAPTATQLNVQAASTNPPVVKDNRSGGNFQCPTVSMTGSARTGANQPPNGAMKINRSVWGPSCTAAGGSFYVRHTAGSVWSISPTMTSTGGVAPFPANKESTPISVTGVSLSMTVGTCSFVVSGSMSGTYNNGDTTTSPVTPPMITITGSNLTVSNVVLAGGSTSCFAGIIQNGDTFTIIGGFNMSATNATTGAAANPLRIHAR